MKNKTHEFEIEIGQETYFVDVNLDDGEIKNIQFNARELYCLVDVTRQLKDNPTIIRKTQEKLDEMLHDMKHNPEPPEDIY